MSSLDFLLNAVLALALGGLIGLEREQSGEPWLGVRSFALLALLGLVVFFMAGEFGVLVGLSGVLLLGVFYYKAKNDNRASHGVTTALMIPLVFMLGVMIGFGRVFEALVVAVASTFLLAEKREVHELVSGITKREIIDLLVFALTAFIVYPLLPAGDVRVAGAAINLQSFWGIVVIVNGIGLFGHAAVKYFKTKGFELAAFFSGVVSSLAAVVVFARENKRPGALRLVFGLAFFGALVGDVALLAFVNKEMLLALSPLFTMLGLGFVAIIWMNGNETKVAASQKELSLGFALEFAIVFLLVSIFLSPVFTGPNGWLAALAGGAVSSTSVIAASAFSFSKAKAFAVAFNVFLAIIGSLLAKVAFIYKETGKARELLPPVAIIVASGVAGLLLTGFFAWN